VEGPHFCWSVVICDMSNSNEIQFWWNPLVVLTMTCCSASVPCVLSTCQLLHVLIMLLMFLVFLMFIVYLCVHHVVINVHCVVFLLHMIGIMILTLVMFCKLKFCWRWKVVDRLEFWQKKKSLKYVSLFSKIVWFSFFIIIIISSYIENNVLIICLDLFV
jgi:hypothetical protein